MSSPHAKWLKNDIVTLWLNIKLYINDLRQKMMNSFALFTKKKKKKKKQSLGIISLVVVLVKARYSA